MKTEITSTNKATEGLKSKDILSIITHGMLYGENWFTAEEIQPYLKSFSYQEILYCLLNASGYGFFTYELNSEKYKFKRMARFI